MSYLSSGVVADLPMSPNACLRTESATCSSVTHPPGTNQCCPSQGSVPGSIGIPFDWFIGTISTSGAADPHASVDRGRRLTNGQVRFSIGRGLRRPLNPRPSNTLGLGALGSMCSTTKVIIICIFLVNHPCLIISSSFCLFRTLGPVTTSSSSKKASLPILTFIAITLARFPSLSIRTHGRDTLVALESG